MIHPLQKSFTLTGFCLASNVSTVRASEKSSIMTDRKSYTGFPTVQRAIDELRTLPLSLPKGGSKSELLLFWNKSQLQLNEVCYNVSLTENFQLQIVIHSFPYLTVHRCSGNTNPSTSNVASKWRTPLTMRWIGNISACSSLTVTLIGSRSRAF